MLVGGMCTSAFDSQTVECGNSKRSSKRTVAPAPSSSLTQLHAYGCSERFCLLI